MSSGLHPLGDFHHYRADAIQPSDRLALCERRVIEMLLSTSVSDESRESSVAFELKHHHSVAQLGRILCRKRHLPSDVSTAGALLHDIHVIQHGTYADHAHLGAPLALEILRDIGGFSGAELEQVHTIVFHHSDKHIWSADPLAEFGKDADVLDCFLYPGAFDFYLRHKSLIAFAAYLKRAKAVWFELSIPPDPRFEILDGFEAGWLAQKHELDGAQATVTLAALELLAEAKDTRTCPPPFAIRRRDAATIFATNAASWEMFLARIDEHSHDTAAALRLAPRRGEMLRRLLAFDPELSDADIAALKRCLALGELHSALQREVSPIVAWPLLGRYEVLGGNPSSRAEELGL